MRHGDLCNQFPPGRWLSPSGGKRGGPHGLLCNNQHEQLRWLGLTLQKDTTLPGCKVVQQGGWLNLVLYLENLPLGSSSVCQMGTN